jgi:alkanesulfonate monooxygenase SsuD/methylene tetrahydromethanopterin reductase-like flavin-dependent oxidoreductase (luciferase family)
VKDARNLPPPIQAHLPIMIGGSGEQKTLRTVARFADMWNVAQVTPEEAAHKDKVLRHWCDEVGRDPDEIERTLSLGPLLIRDDGADVTAWEERYRVANPGATRAILSGSSEAIAESVRPYVALGFRHLIYHMPQPYDDETFERFATEVKPALER